MERSRRGAFGKPARLVVCAVLAMLSLVAVVLSGDAYGQANYSGRKVITSGGTYSGNWQSTDPDLPAVEVKTTAPVIIEKCNIRGKNDLIKTSVRGAKLTVRDCRGSGLNPGVAGRIKGRFVHAVRPASLTVEHNYLEGTTGIKVYEWQHGAPNETLKVRYNEAKNIDGRKSTGSGYSTDKASGYGFAQFMMLHSVHDVPGVEIAWNQITEEPNRSRVEDTINIFASGGNVRNPYRVHDNFIDGALPVNPGSGTGTYSGGGILTDGGSVTSETVTQYVDIYRNIVVDSLNHGAKITQGHHNKLYDNVVVRDGVLSDGTVYASESKIGDLNKGAGIALWNAKKQQFFGYNQVYDNKAGWYDPRVGGAERDYRNYNIDTSTCSTCSASNNTVPFDHPLSNDEAAERNRWQERLEANDVAVGPRSGG